MGKEQENKPIVPITRDEVLIMMPQLMENPEQFEKFYSVIKILDAQTAKEVIKVLMS